MDRYTCTLVALGKLREEDQKFQGNLDYTVNLRPAQTSRDKGQFIHKGQTIIIRAYCSNEMLKAQDLGMLYFRA